MTILECQRRGHAVLVATLAAAALWTASPPTAASPLPDASMQLLHRKQVENAEYLLRDSFMKIAHPRHRAPDIVDQRFREFIQRTIECSADLLKRYPPDFLERLVAELRKGRSYPEANAMAELFYRERIYAGDAQAIQLAEMIAGERDRIRGCVQGVIYDYQVDERSQPDRP